MRRGANRGKAEQQRPSTARRHPKGLRERRQKRKEERTHRREESKPHKGLFSGPRRRRRRLRSARTPCSACPPSLNLPSFWQCRKKPGPTIRAFFDPFLRWFAVVVCVYSVFLGQFGQNPRHANIVHRHIRREIRTMPKVFYIKTVQNFLFTSNSVFQKNQISFFVIYQILKSKKSTFSRFFNHFLIVF